MGMPKLELVPKFANCWTPITDHSYWTSPFPDGGHITHTGLVRALDVKKLIAPCSTCTTPDLPLLTPTLRKLSEKETIVQQC
jgi:hypothetical protein